MKKLLFFIVLISVSVSTFAELDTISLDLDSTALDFFKVEPSYNELDPYRQCLDKTKALDLNSKLSCVDEEYKGQSLKLYSAYQHALNKFSGESKQDLIISQQLWIEYRNATCDIYQKFYDIKIYEFAAKKCHLLEVNSRLRHLEELKHIPELTEYLKWVEREGKYKL